MNTERPDHDNESPDTAEESRTRGKEPGPEAPAPETRPGARPGPEAQAGTGTRSVPGERSEPDTEADTEAETGAGPESEADTESGTQSELKGPSASEDGAGSSSGAGSEPRSEDKASPGADAGAQVRTESGGEAGSGSGVRSKPEAQAQPANEADPKNQTGPEAEAEVRPAAQADTGGEAGTGQSKPEAHTQPADEADPKNQTGPEAEAEAEVRPAAQADAGGEAGTGQSKPEAHTQPADEADPKNQTGPEAEAEVRPAAQADTGGEAGTGSDVQSKPEAHTQPANEADPKDQNGPEAVAEAGREALAESGQEVRAGFGVGSRPAGRTEPEVEARAESVGEARAGSAGGVPEGIPQDSEGLVGSSEVPRVPVTPKAPQVQEVSQAVGGPDAPQGADGPGTPPIPRVPDVTGAPDGEGRAGGRRGRSPVVIASVAAAVLLVGGGGAVLAADPGGHTAASGGHGTPRPLVLDGYTAPGSDGTNGIAPGEPNPYGTTYRVAGPLPDGPGSAPVYRARGEVTRDEVARLAEALGVDGTPVADAEAWRVGSGKDGSGPALRVERKAPGAWTFSRIAPGSDDCKGALCMHHPADPSANPVNTAAALKAAAPVLKALGQDDAKADAIQTMGDLRVVNADPRIGGLPTYGWTTGLNIDRQGKVVGGSGQLKAPVKGDTYPVLSAHKTLDLMNRVPRAGHRMGIGGCATPVPHKDRLEAPCGEADSPAPDNAVTIGKAVFGLAAHSSGGQQTLVPSWLFEVKAPAGQDAGSTVAYPAVEPEYLTSTPPPSGQPQRTSPEPRGSDGAPATHDVKVTGYRTEGEELTVRFEGGVCADYRASARESSGRVTVTVTETAWPDTVCIMIAEEYQRTVHLDRPLGDREVVGPDGQAIPLERPGARLPESPSLAR
ncbi:hypothetical protein ACFWOT_28920 [Streptomyces sp. NPDC058440]|uniref:hypothetical protein n=1 Tax=Streptomyces sp. NPDC058440 TaxID=3346501 RepID=UPI00365C62A3